MSGIATAIVGGAVIGAYASGKSSDAQEESTEKGIAAEGRMSRENIEFQREMADQQREDFAPWRDAGKTSLDKIMAGVESGAFEAGKINLQDDPGYQVRMQEGVDALDASASARGRLLSGAQRKGLVKFGQEQGSKEYANAYAREVNAKARRFNILSGLSSTGQASAAGQAQATSQLGQTAGNVMSNLGASQNQAYQSAGAARAGGYQGMATSVNQAAQNWLTYKSSQPAQ